MSNPLICDQCSGDLETDDAVSIVRGICGWCRRGETHPQNRPLETEPIAAPLVAASSRRNVVEPVRTSTAPVTHRRRDLVAGTMVGLILILGVSGYFLKTRTLPVETPATPALRPVTLNIVPDTARVLLDGEEVETVDGNGRLIVFLPEDAASKHWLEVARSGYHTVTRPISSARGTDEINVILLRKPFDLVVRTTPEDAEIWLGDEFQGTAPLTVAVPPSFAGDLTIRRTGYEAATRHIEPPPPGVVLVHEIDLVAAAPVVDVETDPPGAEIFVAGQSRGIAPDRMRLDATDWGRTVTVVASKAGYVDALREVCIPETPGEVPVLHLSLTPAPVVVRLRTDPPGGSLLVDGQPRGLAPLEMRYASDAAGRRVVVEAVEPGRFYGRTEIELPAAGETTEMTIEMSSHGRQVVLAFAAPSRVDSESLALADQLVETIHRLDPDQQFALVVWTDEGVESWPGGSGYLSATSEQKVRAFDHVQSARSAEPVEVDRLISAALVLNPDVVWLFAPGEADLSALKRVPSPRGDRVVSFNVVTTSLDPGEAWVRAWAARQRGTLSVIDVPHASAIAGDIGHGER